MQTKRKENDNVIKFNLDHINEVIYGRDTESTIFRAQKISSKNLLSLSGEVQWVELTKKNNAIDPIWKEIVFSEFRPNQLMPQYDRNNWEETTPRVKSSTDKIRFLRTHFRVYKILMKEVIGAMPNPELDSENQHYNYSFVKRIMGGSFSNKSKAGHLSDLLSSSNLENIEQMIDDQKLIIKYFCLNYIQLRDTLNTMIAELEDSNIFLSLAPKYTRDFLNYMKYTMNSLPNNSALNELLKKDSGIHDRVSYKMAFVLSYLLLAALLQQKFQNLLLPKGRTDSVFEKSKIKNVESTNSQDALYSRLKIALLTIREQNPSFQALKRMEVEVDAQLFPRAIMINHTHTATFTNMSNNNSEPLGALLKTSWSNAKKENFVITGKGGIGKTVSLLSIVIDKKYNEREIPVIYIPLRDLNSHKYWDYEMPLERWIRDIYGDDDYTEIQKLTRAEWNNGPSLIVLLDGYNELGGDGKGFIEKELNQWGIKSGVQLIITSRSEITLNDSFTYLRLQTLESEIRHSYFANTQDQTHSSKLWEVLDTPLMIHLFKNTEKIASQNNNDRLKRCLALKNKITHSSHLLWNYVQAELINAYQKYAYTGTIPFAEYVYAILYSMPYLCWRLIHENSFTTCITKRQIRQWIKTELETHKWNDEEFELYPQLNDVLIYESLGGIAEPSSYQFSIDHQYHIVTESDIFFLKIHGEDNFELSHQTLRDYLAAVHMYNVSMRYKIQNNKMERIKETLPDELFEDNADVLEFFANILSVKTLKYLWLCCRKPENLSFTRHILELYAIRQAYNFKNVDFHNIDLRDVNLNHFRKPGTCRLLMPNTMEMLDGLIISKSCFKSTGHTKPITSLAITQDLYCISIDLEGQLIIWYLPTLTFIARFNLMPAKKNFSDWTILKANKDIYIYGERDVVYRVDINDNDVQILPILDAKTSDINDFKNDETILAEPDRSRCSNLSTTLSSKKSISKIFRSPFDNHTIVTYTNGHAELYTNDSYVSSFGDSQYITDIDFCKPYCACATASGTILVYDLRFIDTQTKYTYKIDCDPGWINCSTITKDAIITGGSDNLIRVYNKNTRRLVHIYEGHDDWVNSLATANNETTIISGSRDGTIKVWTNRITPKVFRGHTASIRMIKHLGERYVASVSDDGSVRIWNTITGKYTILHEDSDSPIFRCLDYDSNTKSLLAGNDKGEVFFWSHNETYCDFALRWYRKMHCGGISSLSFDKYGGKFVTGNFDGTLKVWEYKVSPIDSSCYDCHELFSKQYEDSIQCTCIINMDGVQYCIVALKSGRLFRLEMNHWQEMEPAQRIFDDIIIRNISVDEDEQKIYVSTELSMVHILDYNLKNINNPGEAENEDNRIQSVINKMNLDVLIQSQDYFEIVKQTVAHLVKTSFNDSTVKALNGFILNSIPFDEKKQNGDYVIKVLDENGNEDSDFREMLINNTLTSNP